jgi:hypothetical protein
MPATVIITSTMRGTLSIRCESAPKRDPGQNCRNQLKPPEKTPDVRGPDRRRSGPHCAMILNALSKDYSEIRRGPGSMPGHTHNCENEVGRRLAAGGRWIRTSSSARDRLRFDARGAVSGASGRPRRQCSRVHRFTGLATRLCCPRGRVVGIDL